MIGLLLASGSPLNHVVQHIYESVSINGVRITWLSNHIIMQMLAALLLILVLPRAIRKRAGNDEVGRLVPRGLGNAIEGLCQALRTHVAEPSLGKYTDRFLPYIWTVFFFILTCNLLGMIPLADWTKPLFDPHGHFSHGIGGTSTGNIWVTATLAVCTFILIVYNGLTKNGLAWIQHFFMGPFPISLLIGVLEIIGLFSKVFALTVRLFANMIAGHILLAVLLMLAGTAIVALGTGLGLLVALPVVLGSVGINLLELFVAFLQAFIFTFLTTMFIGQAIHIHHDDEHEHDEHEADAKTAHATA